MSFNTEQNPFVDVTISFVSNYDPLLPRFVDLFFWGEGYDINGQKMNKSADTFSYNLTLKKSRLYIFNMKIDNQFACSDNNEYWLASSRGIRAKELKINNIVIDNNYLRNDNNGNTNIIFKIEADGNITPGSGSLVNVNSNVPPEVWHIYEKINMSHDQIRNRYANAWFSVIHDISKDDVSKVEISSISLYAVLSNGQNVRIGHDSYEKTWEGKLYVRYPYFLCSLDASLQWLMSAELIDENLVFYPSSNTKRVWHGWISGKWPSVPANAESLWVKAEIKITGSALMQIGVDIRSNLNSNAGWSEYGTSDWFYQTNSFQTIYFNKKGE